MGKERPRKVKKGSVSKEENTSNQTAAPTTEENLQSLSDPNTSNLEATDVGTTLNLENTGSPTKSKTAHATSASPRRSDRLKRNSEPVVPLNTVDRKKKESKGKQVDSSPRSTERNLEQEAPHGHQLHTDQAMDERNLVEEATSVFRSPKRSDRLKRKAEPVVPLNLVERKGKASKGKQVCSSPSPITERNLEQEAPRGRQLNIRQAVDERNLVEKGNSSGNADPSADFKSLYMASKRRAEALTEENCELKEQLLRAQGKIDGYEKILLQPPVDTTEKDTPDATDGHKASSSKKKGTGSKKKSKA